MDKKNINYYEYYFINDSDLTTIINYLDFLYYSDPISRGNLKKISDSLKEQKNLNIGERILENG